MTARIQRIRFDASRRPSPNKIRIGYETDNMAERLVFVLPLLAQDQSAFFMRSGDDANIGIIKHEGDQWYIDMGVDLIGAEGIVPCHVRIDTPSGEVWNSGTFQMIVGDVGDVEADVEKKYPSAVGEMLGAIAEHRAEMDRLNERLDGVDEDVETAKSSAETAVNNANIAQAAATSAGDSAAGAAESAGTAAERAEEAVNKAANAQAAAETAVSSAQTAQEAAETATSAAAEAKETLESIPADYTELAQEVGKLSEGIDTHLVKKIQSVNLLSSYEFAQQVLRADGTIEDSTIYVLTDFIACDGGRTLSLTRIVSGSYGAYVRGKSHIYSIAFYDRDKGLISITGGTPTVITDVDFNTPVGTAYVRVCFEKAYVATHQPMLEYSDEGISETFVAYFEPYYVYNENVDNEVANRRTQAVQTRLMSHIQSHQIRFPVPERPEFVKKSGIYNGCLSDIHTVDNVDVLYGFSGSTLVRSAPGTDYGSPNIRMTTASNNSTTNFVKKLDDGTLLVGVENADGAGVAKIFKGAPEVWNSSTSKFDVQWTEVLACETKNLRFSMWFGLSIYKNIVVVGEYGSNNVARNVYMSKDYGNTWSKIFTAELDNTGAGVHIHDVCYDPYSDVIWVCTGDGYWAQNVYWSYDGGTTWHKNYGYKESPSQFTQILPLPNCILFTSDNTEHMAVYRCMRDQVHRRMDHLDLELAYSYYDNYDAESPIGTNGCVVYGKDACVYFGWIERYDVAKTNSPVIATKDGYTFYEVWSDDDTSAMSSGYCGIYGVYGVSDKGNIAISYTNSEANTTNRHSIVMQAPAWKSWETMFE